MGIIWIVLRFLLPSDVVTRWNSCKKRVVVNREILKTESFIYPDYRQKCVSTVSIGSEITTMLSDTVMTQIVSLLMNIKVYSI